MPKLLINIVIVFILVFSCLAYGGVEASSLALIEGLVVLIFLAWLMVMTYKGTLPLARLGLILPLLLFLGIIALQLLKLPAGIISNLPANNAYLYRSLLPPEALAKTFTLSIYPYATFSELLKFVSYFAVFYLTINSLQTKRQFAFLINIIIFLGFAISIFGIIQKFSYSGKVYWFDSPGSAPTPFGPFVNRNHFAGYINMIIPLSLGYLLTDMPLAKRVIYGFCAAIMTLALFLSLSRSGIMVYVLFLSFMLFLSGFKKDLLGRTRILYVCFLIAVCLFASFGSPKAILERFAQLFTKDIMAGLGHGYLWRDIFMMWLDFPIFGMGLGTFRSISGMYKSIPGQELMTYAHCDFLQLLAESGILGFSFLAVFFILYFNYVVRMWRQRKDSFAVSLVLGGLTSIWAMLVFSWLDFNLHIPANAFLLFVITGLVYRLVSTHFEHG